MLSNKTSVTAIIVCKNAEDTIEKCIQSLLAQDFRDESKRFEIIIVDGKSTDKTLHIVESYKKSYPDLIRVFINEKGTLAPGWNIGIVNARGDYVVRVDAHAELKNNYISSNLKILSKYVDVVASGGNLITVSTDGVISSIISLVQSTKFGVGNSEFRTSSNSNYVDTVSYGLYRKEAVIEVGLLNEKFIRNQDNELHSRLKEKGWKFYLNSGTSSIYKSRTSLKKLVKQAFGNGTWNVKMLKTNLETFKLRYFIPLLFVLFLIFETLLFLSIGKTLLFWKVVILYATLGFLFSYKKSHNIFLSLLSIPIYFIYHTSYGMGSIYEVFIEGEINNEQ